MGTSTKRKIGKEDIELYDGRNRTFDRIDSTGGTTSITKYGDEVDVLQVFGAGASYTAGVINTALQRIGSSNRCILLFQTGTWTIDANVTIPSNYEVKIPYGCYFDISSGVTLTINGSLDCGAYNIYSGAGTLTIAGTVIPQWWGVMGDGSTDDSTAIGRMTTGSSTSDRAIVWSKATYKISANTTLASNFTNILQAGAVFSVDSSITLTINGPIFYQANTWSSGSGTVTYTHTNNTVVHYTDMEASGLNSNQKFSITDGNGTVTQQMGED